MCYDQGMDCFCVSAVHTKGYLSPNISIGGGEVQCEHGLCVLSVGNVDVLCSQVQNSSMNKKWAKTMKK
ncbi:hypothetical protein GDO81_017997 [Engystomops pustulosus]|uniref:Uncharacterized protein n=1 Tax=Engystomops pustulosus TaxID=76066 RepID=A0AAV7A833_ENGPU|nr:hypothetical protein GDO81_017997 [Engystomops pustulosus]